MIRRVFINEQGNRIEIAILNEIPDSDAVCTICRWRGGHNPECECAKDGWPTISLPSGQILIQIVGPNSTSQNFLTHVEAVELERAMAAWRFVALELMEAAPPPERS